MCKKRCLPYSLHLAELGRHVFIYGLSDLQGEDFKSHPFFRVWYLGNQPSDFNILLAHDRRPFSLACGQGLVRIHRLVQEQQLKMSNFWSFTLNSCSCWISRQISTKLWQLIEIMNKSADSKNHDWGCVIRDFDCSNSAVCGPNQLIFFLPADIEKKLNWDQKNFNLILSAEISWWAGVAADKMRSKFFGSQFDFFSMSAERKKNQLIWSTNSWFRAIKISNHATSVMIFGVSWLIHDLNQVPEFE